MPRSTMSPRRLLALAMLGAALMPGIPSVASDDESAPRTTDTDRLDAARAFLATLEPSQRSMASAPISAPDRTRWSYLPEKRLGLSLADLDEIQRAAWRRFLASALTPEGMARVDRIRGTEPDADRGGGVFTGPDVFFVRFHGLTGEPDSTPRAWAWRIEGHHLHAGETIVDGRVVSMAPFMLGSVRRRDVDGEVFESEDAAAARLLAGLDAAARGQAWTPGPMPGDMRTAMLPPERWRLDGGLDLGQTGPKARMEADGIVRGLLDLRRGDAVAELGDAWAALPDDQIRFAWVGDPDRGRTHQWRLVSPVLVVEFSHSGGDANHGHLAWRTPSGEFPGTPDGWRDAP